MTGVRTCALPIFAIALASYFSEDPGNARAAVTGAVHPNGTIRAVGGVGAKIRAAADAGFHFVVIPSQNANTIYELDAATLLGIQVIAVNDADKALPFLTVSGDGGIFLSSVTTLFWAAVHLLCEGESEIASGVLDSLISRVPAHLTALRVREIFADVSPAPLPEPLARLCENIPQK